MSQTNEVLFNFMRYLPKYDEIASIFDGEAEAAYILSKAIVNLKKVEEAKELSEASEVDEETYYLIECLVDRFHERIHTGKFCDVPMNIRKIYALANIYKIIYLMIEDRSPKQIETCSSLLDDAMLVGSTVDLYEQYNQLQQALMDYFDAELNKNISSNLPIFEVQTRQPNKSDVLILDCPSVMDFSESCFVPQTPALLLNTFTHWPAVEKWRDLNYINRIAGNRRAPIEIGNNYTDEEWSQHMVRIRGFLQRQFSDQRSANDATTTKLEYLAQHELFSQIPALKADIQIPDYCTLRSNDTANDDVDIKAWLGPRGTVSPMHHDPKHNLLCQIFGTKNIILAAPTDTEFLYPHEEEMFANTSQIDAEYIDIKRFPLTAKARFYKVTLQAGDCLYIPPKWWHYVRAESPSFSVSFWF